MEAMASVGEDSPEPDARELQLIDGALAMVASGASSRVTLAGFERAAQFLPYVQERARAFGLLARGIWHDQACDIAIQPYG
jgi:hypothetical protein